MGRDEEKAQAVATELGCAYVVADIADAAGLEVAFKKAVDQNGPVDVLVNNAGIWIEGDVETNAPEDIQRALQVNALGVIFASRLAVPAMKQRKAGRIVNVISQAGLYGNPGRSIYIASKFAVTGFTKSLQAELKPFNIAVDAFYPATMNTQFFAKAGSHKDRSTSLDPALAADAIVYMCGLPGTVSIPEFGMKDLRY